jgi:phenylacetate-CoA ligase
MANLAYRSGGLELSYETHGDAPSTIVLHPGVGFPRTGFRPLAKYLSASSRCVLLDPRGCGESQIPRDDKSFTLERMSEDLLALLDVLRSDRSWIIGHSLGANVAIDLAIRKPDRVLGLVLISPSLASDLVRGHLQDLVARAPQKLRAFIERHEARGPVMNESGAMDPEYARIAGELARPQTVRRPISPESQPSLAQSSRALAALWGRKSAFEITGLMKEIDQRSSIAALSCPVLVIAGEADPYTGPSLPIFAESVRSARILRLEGVGHHAHLESPGRVAEAVLSFIGGAPKAKHAETPELRLDVELSDAGEGAVVEDADTGFRIELGPVEKEIIRALGAPLDEISRRVIDLAGGELDPSEVRTEVEGFLKGLSNLGLLTEGLSRGEIVRRQREARMAARIEERWRSVVEAISYAYERVPFHRERLNAAGVRPEDLSGPEDLARIPIMTKADIRASFDRLLPEGLDVKALVAEGKLTIGATSGSTDERLQVLFSFELGTLPERYSEIFDLSPSVSLSRGAVFTTPRCAGFECHLGMSTKAERTRGSVLTLNSSDDVFHISVEEIRAIAKELGEHRPEVLFVNPWYAAWLLRRAAELGVEWPQISAVLPSYQYLTRRHRTILRDGFGAPVFSYYGATDLGGSLIGVECSLGSMHVREDQSFLEIEPIAGHEAPFGLITVTTLNNRYMPLVRYSVGDLARWVEPCRCEIGAEWRAIALEGRSKDVLRSATGAIVSTRMIDEALGDEGPDFYQLEQHSAQRFQLSAFAPNGLREAELVDRLRAVLGDVRIDLERVTRFSPERSLKFRQTMSHEPLTL